MKATPEKPALVTGPETRKPVKSKILLVDEDPAIRQILLRLLAEEDYFALTAANGAEALELANATQFDLVLLDLNMPVEDGWETFQRFSAKDPRLPIILITACPNQLSPVLAAGVGALLEKPLDFAKLFCTIQNLLAEPAEVRMARCNGRPPVFHHLPSKPAKPEPENEP
jgi:DNA-binding response OmpR family regulator